MKNVVLRGAFPASGEVVVDQPFAGLVESLELFLRGDGAHGDDDRAPLAACEDPSRSPARPVSARGREGSRFGQAGAIGMVAWPEDGSPLLYAVRQGLWRADSGNGAKFVHLPVEPDECVPTLRERVEHLLTA